jgi:D-alanyl-D-alanine carboxypeptidase
MKQGRLLGMAHTRFADPTGLGPNVSIGERPRAARGRGCAVSADREFSTTDSHFVEVQPTGQCSASTTPTTVRTRGGTFGVEDGVYPRVGKCLVMLATIASKPFVIVLLDSAGK